MLNSNSKFNGKRETMDSSVVNNGNLDDSLLSRTDIDATLVVRNFLKDVKSGEEVRHLQLLRSKLNSINSHSSDLLKKEVFLNYQQFIDTSKEISHLEREIFELTSLLSDQKNLIENLMQMNGEDRSSIGTSSSAHNSSNTLNHFNTLIQKMDGIATVLNNLPCNERVLLHGEVMQLDVDSRQPVHVILLVLLTDRMIIGYPSTGKYRFQMESSHHLNAVAAVNVKDRNSDSADTLFKLLIFPDQRLFRVESSRVKREWLDTIEIAKKNLLQEGLLVRQATIRGNRRRYEEAPSGGVLAMKTKVDPNLEPKVSDESAWLSELPAELDDCIAHRDLEQAVELIMEWKTCSTNEATIDSQLSLREAQIVQLLIDEVRRPGALHGGPRAVRRAINLLANLGRAPQAIDLYLKKRSAALRSNARDLTVSEDPLSYVRQLSQHFLGSMSDVISEFLMQPEQFSSVLLWCFDELNLMLSLIRRHVIEVAPTIAVLAHTCRILATHCETLVSIGADFSFEVHRLLTPSLKTALESNFANIIESIRLRISEERWRVYNMETESNVNRFLEEMSDMGLSIDWALVAKHRSCINITQNACHFSRVAHSLSRDLAILRSSRLSTLTDSFLQKLWFEYLTHLSLAPFSPVQQHTCTFIISQLLPLCDNLYSGSRQGILGNLLRSNFAPLLKYRIEFQEVESNMTKNTNGKNDLELSSDEEVAHV